MVSFCFFVRRCAGFLYFLFVILLTLVIFTLSYSMMQFLYSGYWSVAPIQVKYT